jgi:hypothetical protein
MKTIVLSITLAFCFNFCASAETTEPKSSRTKAEVSSRTRTVASEGKRETRRVFIWAIKNPRKHPGIGGSHTDQRRARLRSRGSSCGDRRNASVRGF